MIQMTDARVPVTLLTGFLGAGKTTLLNRLVQDPDAGRLAVIINEFGSVGLDHDLIEGSTEETVLLQSGCLCCSILGDLAKILGALISKRAAGKVDFDRVVIETSGIADPGPILHTLTVDRLVSQAFRLDGVVTVADAASGAKTLDEQFEAVQQVAMADLLVLSKTDLVPEQCLAHFEDRLAGMNASAKRVRADHGRIPVGVLFGLSAMRLDAKEEGILDWLGLEPAADPLGDALGLTSPKTPSAPVSFLSSTPKSHHDRRICSVSIEVEEPISSDVFDFWLDTLISLKGPNILRIKGILHVQDMEWPFVFHGVQHIFDMPIPLKNWTGEDTISRVVVIARDMNEEELNASIQMLRMHPSEAQQAAIP